jgi:acetyl esterase/lipase
VFYANEESSSGKVLFYLHGGAYRMDFTLPHWNLLEKLVRDADAELIAPTYRLVPFATYKEAFELIVPLYQSYCEAQPEKKIILMGDSAGGGLALALAEVFKSQGIRLPDELVLISPWVDVVMDNEEIKDYEPRDPFLAVSSLRVSARHWMDDLDGNDPKVSPIYGDLKGIRNVTVFVGTGEIFYPDVTKFYSMLDPDPSNELIVAEDMNHVYPLYPIPEAKPAVEKIIQVVKR